MNHGYKTGDRVKVYTIQGIYSGTVGETDLTTMGVADDHIGVRIDDVELLGIGKEYARCDGTGTVSREYFAPVADVKPLPQLADTFRRSTINVGDQLVVHKPKKPKRGEPKLSPSWNDARMDEFDGKVLTVASMDTRPGGEVWVWFSDAHYVCNLDWCTRACYSPEHRDQKQYMGETYEEAMKTARELADRGKFIQTTEVMRLLGLD